MKIVLITLLILTGLSAVSANAQNEDAEQRERDMKIAEEILSEIFSDANDKFELLTFYGRNIRSEYIPGFGAHFLMSSGSFAIFAPSAQTNSSSSSVTVLGTGQGSEDENELTSEEQLQEVRERIHEYLLNYAPLIRGLPANEWVRVTYSPNYRSSGRVLINGRQTSMNSPGITVWARMADLQDYRERSISENEMLNRIESSSIGKASDYKDLSVFSSVLKTSLNNLDTEHLRVRREPVMTYLPGLGVRYQLNASAGHTFILNEFEIFDDNFQFRMDSMRMDLTETLKMLRENLEPLARSMDSLSETLTEEERDEIQEDIQEQQEELQREQERLQEEMERSVQVQVRNVDAEERPDLDPDADMMINELESILETYGSTLTSLENDEMLMISIEWGGRDEDLPDRTELRIRKGDLLDGDDPEIIEYRR